MLSSTPLAIVRLEGLSELKKILYGELELSGLYVRVLISLWLFLFAVEPKEFFFRRVKEVRTTKSQVCGAQGKYVNM
jgi:hypothetical protein